MHTWGCKSLIFNILIIGPFQKYDNSAPLQCDVTHMMIVPGTKYRSSPPLPPFRISHQVLGTEKVVSLEFWPNHWSFAESSDLTSGSITSESPTRANDFTGKGL
jgi:hypothetical protein